MAVIKVPQKIGVIFQNYIPDIIKKNTNFNGKTVLDIGCGKNSPVQGIKNKAFTVGVDIYKPYIKESKRKNLHNDYVLADINHLPIQPKSFDVTTLFDVIEHLPASQGNSLLISMERISRQAMLILTPNGFIKQDVKDGNSHQLHLSGWTVNQFANQGFKVRGINGLKLFLKDECKPRINHPIFLFFSLCSRGFAYKYPQVAYQVLAIKRIN